MTHGRFATERFGSRQFTPATEDELVVGFREINTGTIVKTDGVLGAMRSPESHEVIPGIISVDLCEVLRYSAKALASLHGKHDYSSNLYTDIFDDKEKFPDPDAVQDAIASGLFELINGGHVQPVETHEEIAQILQSWRNIDGVYTLANTSTLEGCELATVKMLGDYYPDCFDGIVFPRNYNGAGKITKADALRSVLGRLREDGHDPHFAAHIDDTRHHVEAMTQTPPHESMTTFVLEFESNVSLRGLTNVVHGTSALEVFELVDDHVKERSSAL